MSNHLVILISVTVGKVRFGTWKDAPAVGRELAVGFVATDFERDKEQIRVDKWEFLATISLGGYLNVFYSTNF